MNLNTLNFIFFKYTLLSHLKRENYYFPLFRHCKFMPLKRLSRRLNTPFLPSLRSHVLGSMVGNSRSISRMQGRITENGAFDFDCSDFDFPVISLLHVLHVNEKRPCSRVLMIAVIL